MDNWIDLSNLPKRKDGKISWKDCDHNLVNFCYKDKEDYLYVEKRIDVDNVLVNFNNNLYDMNIISLQRVCLGKLYNFSIPNNYYYRVGDRISRDNSELIILQQIRVPFNNGKTAKGYHVKCLSCSNEFDISENNLCRGDGCSVCSSHIIVPYYNDIYTTRPDLYRMLKNKSDGHKYAQFSNKKVEFICPKCGIDLGCAYISNVAKFGLSCPNCDSKISFPNRLMYFILTNCGLDFMNEVVFDWCVFPDFKNPEVTSYGRYDFVVNEKRIIIEMDGGLGHGNDPHPLSRYSKEELIYRDKMKDVLAKQNKYNIVRIDCNYKSNDRFDYCVNNILNSELSNLIDLFCIDWDLLKQSM